MSEQLQLRRGSASQIALFTGAQGELAIDTTNNIVRLQDGATAGGWPVAMATRTAVADAAYAALVTDRIIAYTSLSAARIVTLPAASAYPTGATLIVLDESGSCSNTKTISVARAGSDTIAAAGVGGGLTSVPINSAYGFMALESNGSNQWLITYIQDQNVQISGSGNPSLVINKTPASLSAGNTYCGVEGEAGGNARWFVLLGNATNETGSNVGSDLVINRYADNGTLIDIPFKITRSTGLITAIDGMNLTGGLTVDTVSPTGAVTLAAGTTSLAPLILQSGTNLTTAAAGDFEFDGSVLYFSVAASERGVLAAEQFEMDSAAYTLTSQTAAQALLNTTGAGTITLANGNYQFECEFALSSMSATSGSFGFALGGTATFGTAWLALASMGVSGTPTATYSTSSAVAAQTSLTANSTSTAGNAFIKGIIRITSPGTIIPQVSLTTAAAAVVSNRAYFKISPLGSNATYNVGHWS